MSGRSIGETSDRKVRNIRLIVAYDGTDLKGYQLQPADKGPTVQGELEAALSKVCNEPISIYGASRTDAGVHARFQVVCFQTTGSIPTENFLRALIAHLPPSIVIRQAEEIPLDWKPRWNIWGKEYIYSLRMSPIADPIGRRFHWHINKALDIEAMAAGGRALEGKRDCSTLQGANSTPADPMKEIYAVRLVHRGEDLDIHVVGDGFLYHMVRNIAGLLVDIGMGRRKVEDVEAYMEARDRRVLGKTAPAQGLCLERIFFTKEELEGRVDELRLL